MTKRLSVKILFPSDCTIKLRDSTFQTLEAAGDLNWPQRSVPKELDNWAFILKYLEGVTYSLSLWLRSDNKV